MFECELIRFSVAFSANGDVIVTLLPINTKWPWITPAIFRPELVPEELMAQGLTVRMCFVSAQTITFQYFLDFLSSLAHS